MAWTAPRTWLEGEQTTAAILTAHLRDNLRETAPAKIAAAGDLAIGAGANALKRLGIGKGGQFLQVAAGIWAWVDATPAALARASYGPAADRPTTSTTFVNVDAALAVTFTAPASGLVLVCLQGLAEATGTGNGTYYWNLRDAGVGMAGTEQEICTAPSGRMGRIYRTVLSGLTGSKTLTWGHKVSVSTTTGALRTNAVAGTQSGSQALMEVWAL
ncbi:MAG: hypothetical protein ACT4PO_13260 [Actinomycetota bacterium]